MILTFFTGSLGLIVFGIALMIVQFGIFAAVAVLAIVISALISGAVSLCIFIRWICDDRRRAKAEGF